jgi:hypothetical protein
MKRAAFKDLMSAIFQYFGLAGLVEDVVIRVVVALLASNCETA